MNQTVLIAPKKDLNNIISLPHRNLKLALAPLFLIAQKNKKKFAIKAGNNTFGRSKENDLVLDFPSISRLHGSIEYNKNGEVIVNDLDSSNGITHNGNRLKQVTLKEGESILLGEVEFLLEGIEEQTQMAFASSQTHDDDPRTMIMPPEQIVPSELELVVVKGTLVGTRFGIKKGRTTYGRDVSNNIVIPDKTISRHHGVIEYNGNKKIICYDLASANGIATGKSKSPVITVKVGGYLQVGTTTLKLEKNILSSQSKNYFKLIGLITSLLVVGAGLFIIYSKTPTPPVAAISAPATAQTPASATILETTPAPIPTLPPITEKTETKTQPEKVVEIISEQKPIKKIIATPNNREFPPLPKQKTSQSSETANTFFTQGNYEQAFLIWSSVIAKNPTDITAQNGLNQLETVAGHFIDKGIVLMIQSKDQAIATFKKAMSITQPNSSNHLKAAKFLKQLENS